MSARLATTACSVRSWRKLHLPNWLKLLAILTLLMLGLPAVASAHCDHPGGGDSATAVVATVQDTVVTQSAGAFSAPTHSVHFYETSQLPTQKSCCTGSCCCHGMSHCGSSGSSSMLIGSSPLVVPKLDATRIAHFEDQVLKQLDTASGLERHPRG